MQVRTIRTTIYEGEIYPPGEPLDVPDGVARTLIGLGKCVSDAAPRTAESTGMNRAVGLEGSDSAPPKRRTKEK